MSLRIRSIKLNPRNLLLSGVFFLAVLSLLFIGGCSDNSNTPTPASTSVSTPTVSPAASPASTAKTGGYSLKIFFNDKQVASFSLDDLRALPQLTLTVKEADKVQQGPSLLSVINAAGITDFSQVTVSGWAKQKIATAEAVLKKAQLNDRVILDITGRNATKLADGDMSFNDWIIDLEKLVVK